ncbi:MAG: phytanoyl-CoA dioxygenase family protein [Planctomycetaceae bacterium]|jgi:hypothetical protein|nr:phytanoyl-CoA dioxygenase family protein [Planctomycetaceae bacterium]MDP7278157.1 phytanoyl-CoA dioxygenase family protein [Planctomycetaceae bacterium]
MDNDLMRQWDRDGFFVTRNLLSADEVELLGRIARADTGLRDDASVRSDGEGRAVSLRVRNDPSDDIYGTISRSRRIVSVMEQLLGGEVYHYHHKLIFKDQQSGGAWVWHQDYGYWYDYACLAPLLASCMIAIDPATRANGCLKVLSGSHRMGRIDHGPVGDQTGADLQRVAAIQERLETVHVELDPGDAVFFHCNLLHRSDANTTPDPRWTLICCYNAARNNPYREIRHPQYTPLKIADDSLVLDVGEQHWSRLATS